MNEQAEKIIQVYIDLYWYLYLQVTTSTAWMVGHVAICGMEKDKSDVVGFMTLPSRLRASEQFIGLFISSWIVIPVLWMGNIQWISIILLVVKWEKKILYFRRDVLSLFLFYFSSEW